MKQEEDRLKLLKHIRSALVIADESNLIQVGIALNQALVLLDGEGMTPPQQTDFPNAVETHHVASAVCE